MKKLLPYIFIFLYPFISFANGFTIKGNIEGLQTGTATLAFVNGAGDDTTLTTHITGGKFTFSGKLPEPEQATLSITEGWSYSFTFFMENAIIKINLVKDDAEKTEVTGSASNTIYQKLKPELYNFFGHARQNIDAHPQTEVVIKSNIAHNSDSVWAIQQHQWIQTIRSTIAPNPDNYAALYFIQWLLFKPDNLDSIMSLFMQLSPVVRNGPAAKKFLADFEHLHKISPGSVAPEIAGNDTLGQPAKLANYRGKVLLLDFWASYCGPCRQENRKMISVYQKYHAEGFEMVSVSLDNERPLWVNAIRSDGLPWPQASELRGGAGATPGTYDITTLPRNVLIDRTGKIYAKDLHGAELIEAVENLLQKGK